MPRWSTIAWRGFLASPFVAIMITCYTLMDPAKMEAIWLPILDSGRISWKGGSIPILETFYHNAFLDSTWKPFTVLFSPSALGYDPVSWWNGFSFMHNLAPLYAIWMIESHRPINNSGPARWPTIFTVLGQNIGTGTAVPLFYFLCFVFGPRSSSEVEVVVRARGEEEDDEKSTDARAPPTPPPPPLESARFVLPLMLLFHTLEICMAYLAPLPETRHYFTWTWQFLPLWAGLADALLTRLLARRRLLLLLSSSPSSGSSSSKNSALARLVRALPNVRWQLGILAAIAGAVWVYMLRCAPYSLAEILLPPPPETPAGGSRWLSQEGLLAHGRLVLQVDNLCTFAAGFLWFGYSYAEMFAAGVMTASEILSVAAVLPIVVVSLGPGVGVVVLWLWRERQISKK